jgi:hypothetical protein
MLAVSVAAIASVPLDFQVSYDPLDATHIRLRAITAQFGPSPAELRQAATVADTPEELAVILFVAREGHGDVAAVASRRAQGKSWADLMRTFGVSGSRLYLPLPAAAGVPYVRPSGYRSPGLSREPIPDDATVEDLVNLQVVAAEYRVDPMEVVAARRSGKSYAEIHRAHVTPPADAGLARLESLGEIQEVPPRINNIREWMKANRTEPGGERR